MERAERLGKYELLRHLASGGMARVFLARVDGVGGFARHLVLKTVRPERTEDSSYVSMFLDEARLIATLHHQHVAQVYDVGVAEDGTYFLAMEYLHGETVRAILERARDLRERLPLDCSLTIVAAAAAGLHHAHERRGPDGRRLGIVHRDVTPSNVIAGYDGSVKLIDFGIAKAAERSHQTKTGFIKGKAGYMAPEQALGQPVDRRADVFSLGVVLYELTTQTRAFPASSELEVAHRIVRGEVTPPSMAVQGYPIELEDVIMTALARDPDERFGDAEAFGYALDQAAHQLGVSTGPSAVSRVMAQLFGTRPEPWLVPQAEEPDEHDSMTGDTASLLDARPLRVTSGNTSGPSTSASAVGFARGTGAQDDPSPRRARGTTNQPPVRARTESQPVAAGRPRTQSEAPPVAGRPRTQSEAPPLRPDPPPLSKRAPTVPMRAQTPPPLAAGSNDVTLDEDSDAEMPTVKFLSLDEAEIIIEQPGKGARVVAPPAGSGKKLTPLPGVPPIVAEASPLPVAVEGAGPVAALDSGSALARDQRVEPPGFVPTATERAAPPPMVPASQPAPMVPAPPVLPAVAAVPRPPPSKIGNRTEPVTALDRVLESQAHRARHRRWLLPLAGGAVLAVAVVAIGFAVLGGDDDDGETAPSTALARPEPAPPAPPPPPPAPPAETSTIHVRITTTPSDATVLLDGERLGRTPLDIERPRKSGTAVLKVRRKGYSTKKLDVDVNADVVHDFKLNKSDRDD